MEETSNETEGLIEDEDKRDEIAKELYCKNFDKEKFESCTVKLDDSSFYGRYLVRVKFSHDIDTLNKKWKGNKDALDIIKETLEEQDYRCSLFKKD